MTNWGMVATLLEELSVYKHNHQEIVSNVCFAGDVVDALKENHSLFFIVSQKTDEDYEDPENQNAVCQKITFFSNNPEMASGQVVLNEGVLNAFAIDEWTRAKKVLLEWFTNGKLDRAPEDFDHPLVDFKAKDVVDQLRGLSKPKTYAAVVDNGDEPVEEPQKKNTPVSAPPQKSSKALKQEKIKRGLALQRRVREEVLKMDLPLVYEVGGCIRSELLGQEIKDIDIAVCGETADSLYEKIKNFGHADALEVAGRPVGFRLYTPWAGPGGIEFALSRTEISTGEGHHDFDIVPSDTINIEEDLLRRDFTINAMARNLRTGQLVDPFGGEADCKNRVLRTVSPTSFRDDPLRMLRGLVRVSKDDLRVEETTLKQMHDNAELLASSQNPVSGERVLEELSKMLDTQNPHEALSIARDTKVLQSVIPQFEKAVGFDQESKYHDMTVDEHIFKVVENACKWNAPEEVRFAALFHDIGKPDSAWRGEDGRLHYFHNYQDPNCPRSHEEIGADMAAQIWRDFGGDKKRQAQIQALVQNHMYKEDEGSFEKLKSEEKKKLLKLQRSARRWLVKIQPADPEQLMLLRRCDRAGKNATLKPDWDKDQSAWESVVRSQLNQPISRKDLKINGNDIMALGFKGKEIGNALDELLSRVIDEPDKNNQGQLKNWAMGLKKAVKN